MPRTLEIPPVDEVQQFPKGNRAYMFVDVNDHHDASLALRCESPDSKYIDGAGITLRTRTGQGGYSYHTANAIADIVRQSSSGGKQLAIGSTVWRPAERHGGIIELRRETHDSLWMTVVQAKDRCRILLTLNDRILDTHSISLEQELFRRFLLLGGAMRRDWEVVDEISFGFKGMLLHEAIRKKPGLFFSSSHQECAEGHAAAMEKLHLASVG